MASGVGAITRAVVAGVLGSLVWVGPVGAANEGTGAPAEAPGPALAGLWRTSGAGPFRGDLTPNQLTAGRALTREQALAACGPAAAVAFVRATGRDLTLDAAVAEARKVGWTQEQGMAGPWSQLSLLRRLQVAATLEASIDRAKIASELQAGRPVIVRTSGRADGQPGHYLVAEGYDPATGRVDFGQSAAVLRQADGQRWFTLDEVGTLGVGAPTHAIYLLGSTLSALTAAPMQTLAAARPAPAAAPVVQASTSSPSRRWVVDAGGTGARLRAEPSTEATIVGLLADGARVTEVDTTTVAGERIWRRVVDADGTTAWIDGTLLRGE